MPSVAKSTLLMRARAKVQKAKEKVKKLKLQLKDAEKAAVLTVKNVDDVRAAEKEVIKAKKTSTNKKVVKKPLVKKASPKKKKL